MPLAKSHSLPKKEERKPKAGKLPDGKIIRNGKAYERVEAIIDECYTAYINGETRTHIIKKLVEGLFESQQGKKYAQRSAEHIFEAAFARIKADMNLKREEAASIILSRLESIYEDGISNYDRQSALRALDLMARIYGIDKPQTAIQINTESSNSVTINFGFENHNNEENSDDINDYKTD